MDKLIKGINYGKFIHVKIQYDKKEMEIQMLSEKYKKEDYCIEYFLKEFLNFNYNINSYDFSILKNDGYWIYKYNFIIDEEFLEKLIDSIIVFDNLDIILHKESELFNSFKDKINYNKKIERIESLDNLLVIRVFNKGTREISFKFFDYYFELSNKEYYTKGGFFNAYSK